MLTLGEQTSSQTMQRFMAVVDAVVERHPECTIAIACHGTALKQAASEATVLLIMKSLRQKLV